jgi:hypothetical protein
MKRLYRSCEIHISDILSKKLDAFPLSIEKLLKNYLSWDVMKEIKIMIMYNSLICLNKVR